MPHVKTSGNGRLTRAVRPHKGCVIVCGYIQRQILETPESLNPNVNYPHAAVSRILDIQIVAEVSEGEVESQRAVEFGHMAFE